jgi:hypothetical protein
MKMKIFRSKPPLRYFLDDESIESQLYNKGIGPTPADLMDKLFTMGLKALSKEEKELLHIIFRNNDLQ